MFLTIKRSFTVEIYDTIFLKPKYFLFYRLLYSPIHCIVNYIFFIIHPGILLYLLFKGIPTAFPYYL